MVLMNEATQCSSTPIAPAGRSRRPGIAHQVRAFIAFESSVSFTGRVTRRRPLTARGSATTMPSADSVSNTAGRIAADGAPDCRVVPNPPARPDEASPGKSALARCTIPWFTSGNERFFADYCGSMLSFPSRNSTAMRKVSKDRKPRALPRTDWIAELKPSARALVMR